MIYRLIILPIVPVYLSRYSLNVRTLGLMGRYQIRTMDAGALNVASTVPNSSQASWHLTAHGLVKRTSSNDPSDDDSGGYDDSNSGSGSSSSSDGNSDGSDKGHGHKTNTVGIAVGVAVGVPVFLVIVILVILLWILYRRNKKEAKNDHDPDFTGDIEDLGNELYGNSQSSSAADESKDVRDSDSYLPGRVKRDMMKKRIQSIDPFRIPERNDIVTIREFGKQHDQAYGPYKITVNNSNISSSYELTNIRGGYHSYTPDALTSKAEANVHNTATSHSSSTIISGDGKKEIEDKEEVTSIGRSPVKSITAEVTKKVASIESGFEVNENGNGNVANSNDALLPNNIDKGREFDELSDKANLGATSLLSEDEEEDLRRMKSVYRVYYEGKGETDQYPSMPDPLIGNEVQPQPEQPVAPLIGNELQQQVEQPIAPLAGNELQRQLEQPVAPLVGNGLQQQLEQPVAPLVGNELQQQLEQPVAPLVGNELQQQLEQPVAPLVGNELQQQLEQPVAPLVGNELQQQLEQPVAPLAGNELQRQSRQPDSGNLLMVPGGDQDDQNRRAASSVYSMIPFSQPIDGSQVQQLSLEEQEEQLNQRGQLLRLQQQQWEQEQAQYLQGQYPMQQQWEQEHTQQYPIQQQPIYDAQAYAPSSPQFSSQQFAPPSMQYGPPSAAFMPVPQRAHPQTLESIDELPTPTHLPYSSSSLSLTSFKMKGRQNSTLPPLQTARVHGTALNPMDHPEMFYADNSNLAQSGSQLAPYKMRQSVVMTNPSSLSLPTSFKPAGSIRNVNGLNSRSNSLATQMNPYYRQQVAYNSRVSGLLAEEDVLQPPTISGILPRSGSHDDLRKQLGSSDNYRVI